MVLSHGNLENKNAEINEDSGSLTYKILEGDKDSIRSLSRSYLSDLMANTLDEFCSYPENLSAVRFKGNKLICLVQRILAQYQKIVCGIATAQSSFSDL